MGLSVPTGSNSSMARPAGPGTRLAEAATNPAVLAPAIRALRERLLCVLIVFIGVCSNRHRDFAAQHPPIDHLGNALDVLGRHTCCELLRFAFYEPRELHRSIRHRNHRPPGV